ncbi:helix-turn-helix domain-containing protein [Variovorax sp. J22G21]|uniref:AraC-like ligand-binding domain-containing protein n=1 Tax=Variovorax fucosicus TaxID=3053517 RepID=UPI0025782B97|nr:MULTISPECIES: helix-turn-helix domain-containing protein [unclassified Variovorax]MDM0037471.1 helix-turn-helix domain-containing protein [Variovorax sp. J22R193]MDM0062247.1 helix-turn-helix domain-containing protein [Variovorax sp. J22G21]
MQTTHWSTNRVFACERAAAWSSINTRYFGRLRVSSLDDEPLDASLDTYQVGALRMFSITAPAHHVARDSTCGDLPADEFYKLVLQVSGRGVVEQQHRRVELQPGQWILYDPRAPYTITNQERCTLLVTQVPRALLSGLKLSGPLAGQTGHDNVAGLHGVFGTYLRALSEQLPGLPDGVGQSISESVMGLLGSTLAESFRRSSEPVPLPSVLKLRARQYIHAHLSEPDLSIQGIADALRCSRRYLHRVFEADTVGLERQIWNARLERCHAALTHEGNGGRAAAQIAYAWGFKSNAHFCRLFKQQYGMTPGECQRLALASRRTAVLQ